MDLKEWTLHYVKNKDLLHRKLESHVEKDNKIEFKFKDKSHDYFIFEKLEKIPESNADFVTVVCPTLDENFDFLVKNWKTCEKNKKISFIFVNLRFNRKWIIKPSTHSMIADPESLELGLRTMFEQVS